MGRTTEAVNAEIANRCLITVGQQDPWSFSPSCHFQILATYTNVVHIKYLKSDEVIYTYQLREDSRLQGHRYKYFLVPMVFCFLAFLCFNFPMSRIYVYSAGVM
jgi:hypothetical protein